MPGDPAHRRPRTHAWHHTQTDGLREEELASRDGGFRTYSIRAVPGSALIKGADGVERQGERAAVQPRARLGTPLGVDPIDGQIRQVYFFDTPDLALNRSGVVVRARRCRGAGDDSVVKLRPVVPDEPPANVRISPNFGVEVDAMPGGLRLLGLDEARDGDADGQGDGRRKAAAEKAVLEGAACVVRGVRA